MAKYYATAAVPNIAVEDRKIPFATSDYVAELRSGQPPRRVSICLICSSGSRRTVTYFVSLDLKIAKRPHLDRPYSLDEIKHHCCTP